MTSVLADRAAAGVAIATRAERGCGAEGSRAEAAEAGALDGRPRQHHHQLAICCGWGGVLAWQVGKGRGH